MSLSDWNGEYINVQNNADDDAQVSITSNSWSGGETEEYTVGSGQKESWKRNGD